ncbi:LysR family transcriptional regulator [Anoxybacteroides tepidamans]|uniref:LysR family transcriptional regulator n=1 Tax=Anoxybacteroides tepidamans TaxID=265948 RepID=UPI000489BBA8|nr:LysR family transcriptional regulator [Anoxybacillus tepidamans]
MDLDHIQTFLTVSRLKNFTKAADELHITQSTVTSRIQNLERFYGQCLLLRTNKKVELSPFGKEIYPLLERQFAIIEKTKEIARSYVEQKKVIRVGMTYSLWDHKFVDWVFKFAENNEGVHYSFITDHSSQVVEGILDNTIDIGFVYHAPAEDNIKKEIIGYDSFYLYSSKDVEEMELDAERLKSIPLIYLNWGKSFRHWFRLEFGESYIPFVEVGHSEALLEFVKRGKGVAFIPERVVEMSNLKNIFKKINYKFNITPPAQPIHLIYKATSVQRNTIMEAIQLLKRYFSAPSK